MRVVPHAVLPGRPVPECSETVALVDGRQQRVAAILGLSRVSSHVVRLGDHRACEYGRIPVIRPVSSARIAIMVLTTEALAKSW